MLDDYLFLNCLDVILIEFGWLAGVGVSWRVTVLLLYLKNGYWAVISSIKVSKVCYAAE